MNIDTSKEQGHAQPSICVPLSHIILCGWQPPIGTDFVLQVAAAERRMCLEVHSSNLGWMKFVVNFCDISTLMVTESDHPPHNSCTIDIALLCRPSCFRGSQHSSQQDILWTPEPFPHLLPSPAPPPPNAQPDFNHLTISSRSDLLLGPLRFLVEMDQSIKNAYQAGYNNLHAYQDPFLHHSYSYATSSQIAQHSMENLSTLMTPGTSGQIPPGYHPPSAHLFSNNPIATPPSTVASGDENTSTRFKPTEFWAKSLRVGSWGKKSYCAGDLKCKFLYVKKRIVWEIIDVLGLAKIEVCFKDISSISVQQTNEETVLFVEIAKLPFFYRGYLQKMKNTRWEHTTDVTGGQATLTRIHELHFAKNVLDPHLERLIQSSTPIRHITNITPQMVASFRAHQTSGSTIFTTVVPHNSHANSAGPIHGLASTGLPDTDTTSGSEGHPHSPTTKLLVAPCGCSEPGQCATAKCNCSNDAMWCNFQCGCHGSDCGNPNNQQLTPCSKQHLVFSESVNLDLSSPIRLPCRCSNVVVRQLASYHSCTECGQQYFYSFCFQSVVAVDNIWHCEICGVCRDFREVHCDQCNTCSFADSSGGCQLCEVDKPDELGNRGDCNIS